DRSPRGRHKESLMDVAIADVEIGAANAAGGDLDQQLVRFRHRREPAHSPQGATGPVELHPLRHQPLLQARRPSVQTRSDREYKALSGGAAARSKYTNGFSMLQERASSRNH